jgi:hypothetical protein
VYFHTCRFLGFRIFGRMKMCMYENKIGVESDLSFPVTVPIGDNVRTVGLSDSSCQSARKGRGNQPRDRRPRRVKRNPLLLFQFDPGLRVSRDRCG